VTHDIRISPDEWEPALRATDGPQLVVAGPGTGKTRFLVLRVKHLITSGTAAPEQILILTFSRRSASDIRSRISKEIGGSFTQINCSTFHSFASRLLEAEGSEVVGWDSMPTLLTGPEQVELVSELLRSEQPADWPTQFRSLLDSRTFAADVTDFLLRARERRLGSDDIREMLPGHPDWRGLPDFIDRYHRELHSRGRIDYGTLLDTAISVLADERVSKAIAAQYRYVLVDEYQDTSPAQAALLSAFHRATPNLMVTGDPYQSIYSFRGASIRNIETFPTTFRSANGSPATRIVLTTSFRVPSEILDSALSLTSGAQLPGGAGAVEPASHHGSVEAFVFDQTSAEADWIASEIERLHLIDRVPYARIAVLLRSTRHLVTELSRALARRAIPHDPPDRRLVDHPAIHLIRDVAIMASASDVTSTATVDRALRRLLLGPLFRLPLALERELVRERRRTGDPWTEILDRRLDGVADLVSVISNGAWAIEKPAADGFWHLWDHVDRIADLAIDPNMGEFRAAWTAFSQALERQSERDPSITLIDYFRLADSDDFEAQPLLSHRSSDGDRITLTTLHQAKGLEFDVVFIADAADSVFPDLRRGISLLSARQLDPDIGGSHAEHLRFRLQEEIRLAYTAMTRARRRVVWTATRAGIDEQERRPSRFMVAAVGVSEVAELGAPIPYDGPPVSLTQLEAGLRRIAADPAETLPRRLAAIKTLTLDTQHWDASRFAGSRVAGPDAGVLPERFRLSPSQAEAYETCPRRYVLERRLGIGDGSSVYALFGSLVHEVLERAEKRALDAGRTRSEFADAVPILDQVWSEGAAFGSPAYDLKWREKAAALLQRMYTEWPAESGPAVALEHELQLEMDGLEWIGYADRIERRQNGLAVVDYKTGKSIPSVKDAAASLQLGFYLLAAAGDEELAANGDVIAAESWHPATDRKGWRRAFDPASLDDLTERMRSVGAAIKAEVWQPTPGDACRTCAVRIVCPVQPEGREAFSS
jgi:superfamily I DNA/RNA helicase